jgi:hypothetical protein
VNVTLNIARRLGYKITVIRKIESYLATHNGVKPLNPLQRLTPETQSFETPPFKTGRELYLESR